MTLVLQCAMCGTVQLVGAESCSSCGAAGVAQLRLMFECPTCGRLGLNPACAACAAPAGYVVVEPEEELIVAEEVIDESFSLDEIEIPADDVELVFDLDDEDDADEKLIVDASEDRIEELEEDLTEFDEDELDDFEDDLDDLDELDDDLDDEDDD